MASSLSLNTNFMLMSCKHNAFWEKHQFCRLGDIAQEDYPVMMETQLDDIVSDSLFIVMFMVIPQDTHIQF